jgi:heterodisulfide reductase subunit C
MLSDAEEAGGSEITKAQKEVSEKLGEEGKKIAEIDRNFDKLADDLGFIKTCII